MRKRSEKWSTSLGDCAKSPSDLAVAISNDAEKFVKFCESDLGKKIMDKEAEYLYNELKTSTKILNVGCGIGTIEERLSLLNIVGLDSSEAMLNEARKRSDKTFVLGNAEKLGFDDSSFDAVIYVTTLEFLPDYGRAISEAVRVLKPNGQIVSMVLNPSSEYFKNHFKMEDSYFRRIRHVNLKEIEKYISKFFDVRTEHFLGIKDGDVFDTSDENLASLYVIKGAKLPKL